MKLIKIILSVIAVLLIVAFINVYGLVGVVSTWAAVNCLWFVALIKSQSAVKQE